MNTVIQKVYDHCIDFLYNNRDNARIRIMSAGEANKKAVILAELLKRRIKGLQ